MEPVKKKRIVTKIGHVFCIEIDNQYKCYFQYICNDMSQLNSSVIRVFKKRYPMDYVPVIEDIVTDEVSFYAHTVLKFGIADGAWYRVGKSMDFSESDFDNVLFVTSHDSRIIRVNGKLGIEWVNRMENWWIWKISCDSVNIGVLPIEYTHTTYPGAVFQYPSIIKRIKEGMIHYDGLDFYNH